jgi:hypothetical protein
MAPQRRRLLWQVLLDQTLVFLRERREKVSAMTQSKEERRGAHAVPELHRKVP